MYNTKRNEENNLLCLVKHSWCHCPAVNYGILRITHCECRHSSAEVRKSSTITHSCLLMLSAAMPPCGAAGYMEGMLVVMKSAICCKANRLVGVFPFFS